MKKILMVLLACVVLSGCATVTADKMTAADTQGKLHAGMDFNEVAAIVGRQPSGFSDILTVENSNGSVNKEWAVNGRSDVACAPNFMRYYVFKFKDDKLVSWTWHK